MDLYSLSLGLALTAVAIAVAAAVTAIGLRRGPRQARRWPLRLAALGALASLPLVAFSSVFHLLTGHRPGTPADMGPTEFVTEHPAFLVVVALAALVLGWRRSSGRRS